MRTFLDWLKAQESSAFTRLRRNAALGLAPPIPRTSIHSRSTASPFEVKKKKKRKKKRKLKEAVSFQPRELGEPTGGEIEHILSGLPHRDIVEFALHCAEDCQQFNNDDTPESSQVCNDAVAVCINQVKLWLKDGQTNCRQSARSVVNATDAVGDDDVATWNAAWAAYYAAQAACDVVTYATWSAAWSANYASRVTNNMQEYTQMAQEMRRHSITITYDLKKEAKLLAQQFVINGEIDEVAVNAIIDYFIENNHEIIKEIDGKFKFMFPPYFTSTSHKEVVDKIANSKMARKNIIQHINTDQK